MFVIEQEYPNGTTKLIGPTFRRRTIEKVIAKVAPNQTLPQSYKLSIREVTPWRKFIKEQGKS